MEELADRTALVTGGAQGIGKGIAQRLLQLGMNVLIADLDAEAGTETEREFAGLGSVRFVHTDITNEESVADCLRQLSEWSEGLHAVVNNAAIANAGGRPVDQLTLDDWNRVITTNLTGVFLMTKHAVPLLRESGGGAIVNIASTRALQSEANTEAYSASKGGVVALTHALAMSLGPRIRVNCISPGWIEVGAWKKTAARRLPVLREIDHTQHPAGRVGEPRDIAAMVAFLLSDSAGFITGQNFTVDGGMTKKMIYVE